MCNRMVVALFWVMLVLTAFIAGVLLKTAGALAITPLIILGLGYVGGVVSEYMEEEKA